MAQSENNLLSSVRCFWGIILLVMCLFLALSLFSYEWRDISLLHTPPNSPPSNLIGPVGAWMSFFVFMAFGVGGYMVPLWCFLLGLILLISRQQRIWPRVLSSVLLLLSLVSLMELVEGLGTTCRQLNIDDPAGIYGRILVRGVLIRWLSPVGTGIVTGAVLLISMVFVLRIHNLVRAYEMTRDGIRLLKERVREANLERQDRHEQIEREQRDLDRQRRKLERSVQGGRGAQVVEERVPARRAPQTPREPAQRPAAVIPEPAKKPERIERTERVEKPEPEIVRQPREVEVPRPRAEPAKKSPPPAFAAPQSPQAVAGAADGKGTPSTYTLPPLSLLRIPEASDDMDISTDTGTTGRVLIETLNEFGIEVQIKNVEQGPTVTRYELEPAPGVRVERIGALSNNIALSLKATSVRVQAPVPGKGVVGIEVPNSTARKVYVREIMEGETWQSGKAKLPLALGKDVAGSDLVADLADMPHMLVAGATGAGKTVCINSILAGLLMSQPPSRLRLLLVDPKIVEFSVYNNLPHLVVPVVTDPKKVALALRWAINEMEKRYKLFARAGVRNIESYNTREIATQTSLFKEGAETEQPQEETPATVPYIVIVIDELADLMLVDQAEIENCIARLAQLSRAVGIHMILSTQRPSVNVITGTIKANFPARLAFQVAQKVDSRTILDTVGADKLLGRGDMLFLPPGSSKLTRAQGAMTTDEEIRKITDFIRSQATPSFELEIKDKLEKPAGSMDSGEEDDLLPQAIEIIRETNRASTSSLQRRLRIGYTRAARLMDIMEERGIIGPPRGSDPREILIDLDGQIPDNAGESQSEEESDEAGGRTP